MNEVPTSLQLRQSPSLRLQLSSFKQDYNIHNLSLNESGGLMKEIEVHIEQLNKGTEVNLKDMSTLYLYLINTKFDVKEMISSLKLILCCRSQAKLDVFFFAKGMLYSSIRNHNLEEQIEFMYGFDKLNLLNQYIPKYLDHLQRTPYTTHKLEMDKLIMNFHTISKTIDCRKPVQSREYRRMWHVTNSSILKFTKHKHPLNDFKFEDLNPQ